ncbi:GNAT family N-acetyltransferase [Haemophilus parainfluenzae]|uniref:GNAT family N-acetyltransferase n=1 Tax=Haemophilus parainfluenzae TaxID=729 RepID=UPI00066E44A1|nr:GNAT family N-acetyltransferase [Haemophilus parainfluenzae]
MSDPMIGLLSLQEELSKNRITLRNCTNNKLCMFFDKPEGIPRFTYVIVNEGEILSFCNFVLVEPINDTPCFQIGYAVPEKFQNKGFGKEIAKLALIEFLTNMFRDSSFKNLYIESVISIDNLASQKITNYILSTKPEQIIDSISNEKMFCYQKLFSAFDEFNKL